jgi:DNA repair protein RadD
MGALSLRPYQRAAIDAVYGWMDENAGNPLLVLPTASGKSLVIATLIKEAVEAFPDTRILVLAHVRELLVQNFQELIGYWPDAPAGIYSAGLSRRDLKSQVTFAGIQSIHKHAYSLQRVDLVIVDESHLIPRASNTTYRRFLQELLQINPYLKVIGATATPYRLDSGLLHKGDDAMFSDIAYEAKIIDLIKDGYLCRPESLPAKAQIDTTNVGTRGGEFISGQLEAAAADPATVEAVANEIANSAPGRKGALVFGVGIEHCRMLSGALTARSLSSACIFGDTPNTERDRLINAFKRQEIWSLCSVGTLTTGFNARHVDLIACVRPTKSLGLWIQIVGRGFRTFPGKESFLVLDHGGNIDRHGTIDKPIVKERNSKGTDDQEPGGAPTKRCHVCNVSSPISATECRECGSPFVTIGSLVSTKASPLEILSSYKAPEWIDVTSVTYRRHSKPGKPDSMCVTYHCGLMQYREWVCPAHGGARYKAATWWSKRAPCVAVPNDADEALKNAHVLKKPTRILVRPNGKFFEIVGVSF